MNGYVIDEITQKNCIDVQRTNSTEYKCEILVQLLLLSVAISDLVTALNRREVYLYKRIIKDIIAFYYVKIPTITNAVDQGYII